jgi:hypothetical protein
MKRREQEGQASRGTSKVPAHLREKPKEFFDMANDLKQFKKEQNETISPYKTNALPRK